MARRAEPSRRRALTGFAIAAAVAMIVVVILAIVASQRAGTQEAIRDAQNKTEVLAHAVVEPHMAKGLATGNPEAIALMNSLVHSEVLGPDVARIKIWAADGTIIYSDEARLIGHRFLLGDDETAVLNSGGIEAEVSDLNRPENQYEKSFSKMLEVYLPIRSPEGQPLLFEAYFPYDSVTAAAHRIWIQFAPIIIGGLLLLGLIQLPLAWRLATRVQTDQLEKERLLEAALDASEMERQRIASDLHDGVVQDLSGVALTLAGIGNQLPAGSQDSVAVLDAASHTRGAVRALRSLLVEIYPPNLRAAGIENALLGLTASLEARGIATSLTMSPDIDLPDESEALVFRVTQEALRNVVRHAHANSVVITVETDKQNAVLTIADDGVGIATSASNDAESGHLGLRLLQNLATQVGGTLAVSSAPTGGTIVRLEVPAK